MDVPYLSECVEMIVGTMIDRTCIGRLLTRETWSVTGAPLYGKRRQRVTVIVENVI